MAALYHTLFFKTSGNIGSRKDRKFVRDRDTDDYEDATPQIQQSNGMCEVSGCESIHKTTCSKWTKSQHGERS